MLLTTPLDAGRPLPVHLHPDGAFAADHLQRARQHRGVGGPAGREVHLALRQGPDRAEARRLVREQDVQALLAAMHRVDVAPGDAVLVPAVAGRLTSCFSTGRRGKA